MSKPIDMKDVRKAVGMAISVKERELIKLFSIKNKRGRKSVKNPNKANPVNIRPML